MTEVTARGMKALLNRGSRTTEPDRSRMSLYHNLCRSSSSAMAPDLSGTFSSPHHLSAYSLLLSNTSDHPILAIKTTEGSHCELDKLHPLWHGVEGTSRSGPTIAFHLSCYRFLLSAKCFSHSRPPAISQAHCGLSCLFPLLLSSFRLRAIPSEFGLKHSTHPSGIAQMPFLLSSLFRFFQWK